MTDDNKLESIIFGLKQTIADQKAEIERLTEENTQLEKDVHDMSWVIKIHKYCVGANHCQNRSDGEFELQRQVDELKSENTELYKEHTTLIAGSILEKQNTVKDTAKEILPEMLARAKRLKEQFDSTTYGTNREHLIATIEIEIEGIKNLAKRYGVEVE